MKKYLTFLVGVVVGAIFVLTLPAVVAHDEDILLRDIAFLRQRLKGFKEKDEELTRKITLLEKKFEDSKKYNIKESSKDGRYIVLISGVIQDTKTGLEWYVGPDKDVTWYEAKAWTEGLTVAGGNWRIPTTKELKGIYQKGKGTRNMDPVFKTTGWWVWVGQLYSKNSSGACYFGFHFGYERWYGRSDARDGRGFAVRSGRRDHIRRSRDAKSSIAARFNPQRSASNAEPAGVTTKAILYLLLFLTFLLFLGDTFSSTLAVVAKILNAIFLVTLW